MSGYPQNTLVHFDQNDMLLSVGIKDVSRGPTALTSATVSAQIKNAAGTNVGSAVTCSYIELDNGFYWYEGTVPSDVGVVLGTTGYTCQVTITQGTLNAFGKADLLVRRRTTG